MARSRGRVLASGLIVTSVAGGLTAVGCSLGLDPSLINHVGGADSDGPAAEVSGDSARDAGDGTVKDSAGDARDESPPANSAAACQTDSDCGGIVGDAGGCVTSAKCDPMWHVCMLDVCPTEACSVATCVASTNSCAPASGYGFEAGSFKVQLGGVSMGWPPSAIAAVWPFVFVATTNGLIAYNVVDPKASVPPIVKVNGVPFAPDVTIAVGRRVYFVSWTKWMNHESVAWVDVPQNPLLSQLNASSAWISDTNSSLNWIYTNGTDGLFFVYDPPTALWPSANLHPPLADYMSVTAYPSMNFPSNAAVSGSSGTRLWTSRYDTAKNSFWGALVTAAGTSNAVATSEQQIGNAGPIDNQASFAQGDDGSVIMAVAPLTKADPFGLPSSVGSCCLTWLLDSSASGNFDASSCLPLETYSPPVIGSGFTKAGLTVVGVPGWIDATTALGLAGASSNPGSSTSVHVVKTSPPSVEQGKVAYLPVGPASTGVATSNGFGYVLAQDDPLNQTCTVYVFAPSCAGSTD